MQSDSVYGRMTKAEKEIALVLKELKIQWSYEQPVFVWDENMRPRVWAPDFYLKHFGVYVEVCGSQHFDYGYRRRIFNKNGYSVIFVYVYKEKEKWRQHLLKFLYVCIKERNRRITELVASGYSNGL
jgi:hypothetical protein